MKIGPLDSGDRPQRPDEDERRKADVNRDARQQMNQTDKIEISEVARSLSEKVSPKSEETNEVSSVDSAEVSNEAVEFENRQEMIDQARQRIESGYYNSPEVRSEIARRIADDFAG